MTAVAHNPEQPLHPRALPDSPMPSIRTGSAYIHVFPLFYSCAAGRLPALPSSRVTERGTRGCALQSILRLPLSSAPEQHGHPQKSRATNTHSPPLKRARRPPWAGQGMPLATRRPQAGQRRQRGRQPPCFRPRPPRRRPAPRQTSCQARALPQPGTRRCRTAKQYRCSGCARRRKSGARTAHQSRQRAPGTCGACRRGGT